MGKKNPACAQHAGIDPALRVRWLGALVVALGLMAAGCGIVGSGSGLPNPAPQYPVTTVLVSTHGRVITGVGGMACGHDPRLVARSYPREVTLIWVNPDTNCDAESFRSAVVRARLPEPLGDRALVQASGGGQIPYFNQQDLARVTVLPPGFRSAGGHHRGGNHQPSRSNRRYPVAAERRWAGNVHA